MDYVIIIPAYNEEELLPQAIDSLLAQTLRPRQLILVNDDSTDGTAALVDSYAEAHDFIYAVHRTSEQKGHSGGAKVVAAFYSGFQHIDGPYEFIVKLDADVELPAHYFAELARLFASDEQVGLAGGQITAFQDGRWQREDTADQGHVLGPCKSWRRACFEDIGGLRYTIGWDSIDELLARYYGWTIGYIPQLEIRHYRPMHTHTGLGRVHRRIGGGFYKARFGWLITTIAGLKAAIRYGSPAYLFAVWQGYLQAWRSGAEPVVTPSEGRFFRRYTLKTALEKIGVRISLDGYFAPK